MLIFFGVRTSMIGSVLIKQNVSCDYCNVDNNLRVTVYGSYFHVFWIPIISFGRSVEVTCLHCKKTYSENEIPNNLKPAVDTILRAKTMKSSKWHSFGCLIIGFVFLLTFLLAIYALIYNTFNSKTDFNNENEVQETINLDKEYYQKKPKKVAKWRKELNNLMDYSVIEPSILEDPVAHNIKNCLEPKTTFAEEYSMSYATKIIKDKILILIEVGDYNQYSEDQKKQLYAHIEYCVKKVLKNEPYKVYVGVYKKNNLFMQQSPKESIKDSLALKSELLKSFFE
ncbi:hypothetical protein [Tenacibaculum sp. 190524A05c]|uniref:Zinc ribbon family protein n=1 Tax=Tenacibaculum platacis TaxID=3137852 RepID=A0ABM9NWM0_9FLAO